MKKMLIFSKLSIAIAILALLPACATLTEAESEISVSTPAGLTIGISVSVDNSGDDEEDDEGENEGQSMGSRMLSVLGASPSVASASDFYILLSGSNADIPDQATTLSVAVKSSGSIVGASTFGAEVNNGVFTATNPTVISNWLSNFDHLDTATIEVTANELDVDLPSGGSYQVTNEFWSQSQLLASSTTSGYVSPGGGGYKDPY